MMTEMKKPIETENRNINPKQTTKSPPPPSPIKSNTSMGQNTGATK